MPFFSSKKQQLRVAIIGTGFSGICAAIRLEKKLEIKPEIFEMDDDVAGTWYQNRYPGAECDIPSHLYSYSFELNPQWPKHYSSRTEIHEYIKDVAKKYGVFDRVRFKTHIYRADWNHEQYHWKLYWRSKDDPELSGVEFYDAVISGLGGLRLPNIPPEFEGFKGPIVHTTYWDFNIDYNNKRIAVIGSGASAIQVVPELQKVAKHLYTYQRSPAWVMYRDQRIYYRAWKFILRWVPFVMRFYRYYIFLKHELYYINFGFYKIFGEWVKRSFVKEMTDRLKRVGREDLIPKLIPDYPVGCKRVTKSEIYLESVAQPNVTVIRGGVKGTHDNVVVDMDGNETEVDILVLATGFITSAMFGNIDIYGKDKMSLMDVWMKEKPKSYKTSTFHGFPNFYMVLGPGSALGHNTITTIIEGQVEFAVQCIERLVRTKDLVALEPKKSAQEAFFEEIQHSLNDTVWKGGCQSWYMDPDGEIYSIWPHTNIGFWWRCTKPNFNDFIQYKKIEKVNSNNN
ncbi:hypothetical protein BDA99DRAFT_601395 [Phascolomyces articulosus]|uniref:Uncharacterized protein n=1 Tax=Phascolomyces articulosus TaxID=60185 RepID=A0AAD5KN99_9FUNG|nr:hypothetical protein BDA99DRAFT_601395 [Phascolomyces articulosus]